MAITLLVEVPGADRHRVRIGNRGAVACLDHPKRLVQAESVGMHFGGAAPCPCLVTYVKVLQYAQRAGSYGPFSPVFWKLHRETDRAAQVEDTEAVAAELRRTCWPPRPKSRRLYRAWARRHRRFVPGQPARHDGTPTVVLAHELRRLGHGVVQQGGPGLTLVWRDLGQNDKAVKVGLVETSLSGRRREFKLTVITDATTLEDRCVLRRARGPYEADVAQLALLVEELAWTAIFCTTNHPFFQDDNEKPPRSGA